MEAVNKARVKVNRAVGRFMARNGAVVVRHRELESGVGAFWRSDGVHLNAVGLDMWCLAHGGRAVAVDWGGDHSMAPPSWG